MDFSKNKEITQKVGGVWALLQLLTVALVIALRVFAESDAYKRSFSLAICILVALLANILLNTMRSRQGAAFSLVATCLVNRLGFAVGIGISMNAGFLGAGLFMRIAFCVFVISMHFLVRGKLSAISKMRLRREPELAREVMQQIRFVWNLDLVAAILFCAGYLNIMNFLPGDLPRALMMGAVFMAMIIYGKLVYAAATPSGYGLVAGVASAVFFGLPGFFVCMHIFRFFSLWKA